MAGRASVERGELEHGRRSMRPRGAVLALAAALIGGCASYERRPLDEASHWAEFEARLDAMLTRGGEGAAAVRSGAPGQRDGAVGVEAGDGIDAWEAEVLAMMFSGPVRVARARAGVSAVSSEWAGLWRDPVLGLDVMRMVDGGMDPWEVLASVGFELPLSGRLEAERSMARAAHDVSLAAVAKEEWGARLAVREAWVRWEALRHERAVLEGLVSGLESLVETVEVIERAGEATGLQAGLFRAELSERRAQLAGVRGEAEAAGYRVLAVCGLPPGAHGSLDERDSVEPGDIGSFEESLREARDRSPMLTIARAEYEEAERALALAVREGRPDLEILPGFGSEGGENRVALGLMLPLPMWNGNRRAIAEAERGRDLARVMFEVEAEGLAGELREAYAMWEGAQARAAFIRESLEPQTRMLEEAAQSVARLGEVDVLMLLEALGRRQEAAVMRIEAEREERLTRLRIEGLIGPRDRRGESGRDQGGGAEDRGRATDRDVGERGDR